MSLSEVGLILGEILPDLPVRGFAIDSRLVSPGFVFFALKGETVDGHDFLREVASKGVICAVVSLSCTQDIPGLYFIKVKDPLQSLHKLAKWRMSQKKLRCIAVTGSVGKTTTKEFVATLLEGAFEVRKTPGNANSQVGLPLSILNLESGGDVFVAEMGMSSPLEITSLLEVAPPEFVIVTKIALAHALYFPGGIEEIAKAKAEILQHSHTKKAFINVQARQFQAFQEKRNVEQVFYGLEADPFTQKEDILLRKKDGFFSFQGVRDFTLPFTAGHFSENFLVAALVARELGMDWELIFQQAMKLIPYKMRFEKIEKEGVTYINDAYNANPESVKAALQNLPMPAQGKKTVAVLGEMRELGSFSQKAHREIGQMASKHADLLLCLAGDASYMAEEFSFSGKKAQFFHSLKDLQEALKYQVEEGDVVLVKASKSLKMWEVLE